MLEKFNQFVNSIESELIETRRHLHQYPELSGQEHETAKFVAKQLDNLPIGYKIVETEAGPGVIATLKGKKDSPMIAFRADMDGLPMNDKKLCSYSSKHQGAMHACGHDFNMTSLIGLARTLSQYKDDLEGSVRFIFQPSEENASKSGATYIVKLGVMDDVDAIWTIHALPDLPAGTIGVRHGAITSAVDIFKITVQGKEGHSSRPYNAIDAVYVASQVVNALYGYAYRQFDPRKSLAFAIGNIKGGSAPNIIAETVEMEGTARMFDEEIRRDLPDVVSRISRGVAQSYGADCLVEWFYGPPAVVNDHELARITQECATELLGEDNVINISMPSMGSEDFSKYLWKVPGMLVRVGCGGENSSYPLHNSLFDIDESIIASTVKLLSQITLKYLNGYEK